MKHTQIRRNLVTALVGLALAALGCGQAGNSPGWTKGKKIAGKEQGLSHISNIVVDDRFAYVIIGGTVADSNAGTNGLRKVDFATGAVTVLDDGKRMPQSEQGGLVADEKYLYWNAGGSILRIAKEDGSAETIVSENVGIGIDMAVDSERVYWANHGYYSAGTPSVPKPVYSAVKSGGKFEIFADEQMIPGSIVTDDKFVYWRTAAGINKKARSGGEIQTILQTTGNANVDEIVLNGDDLFFALRAEGNSRFALKKLSKNGGEAVTIAKTMSAKPFVIDDTSIYFFDEASVFTDGLFKVAKGGGEASMLDSGYASGAIALGKTAVYLATLDDIVTIAK